MSESAAPITKDTAVRVSIATAAGLVAAVVAGAFWASEKLSELEAARNDVATLQARVTSLEKARLLLSAAESEIVRLRRDVSNLEAALATRAGAEDVTAIRRLAEARVTTAELDALGKRLDALVEAAMGAAIDCDREMAREMQDLATLLRSFMAAVDDKIANVNFGAGASGSARSPLVEPGTQAVLDRLKTLECRTQP